MRVWDVASGQERFILRGHENWVTSVCFSSDGSKIASGSWDKTVRVWDVASGREQAVLRGHEREVTSICFSPDGRSIASGGSWGDLTVRVWNVASGREQAILRGHKSRVSSVCFSLNGHTLASGSYDKTMRVWEPASGKCLEVIQGSGDTQAIAAGCESFPWWALSQQFETVIECATRKIPVAWFEAAIENINTNPNGRAWTGRLVNQIYFIRLEDGADKS